MKAASLKDIQTELENLPSGDVLTLCLRLARFKKENKELLTYLLFEAFDEPAYVSILKKEMEDQFGDINTSSLYFVKKSLRKILRITAKHTRYTGSPVVEAQLLLHFCATLKASGIPVSDSPVLVNLYAQQVKKIRKAVSTLHEDLQYDFLKELEPLSAPG